MKRHMTRGLWHKKIIMPDAPDGPCVQMGFWRQQDAQAFEQMLHQAERNYVPIQRLQSTHLAWPWTWVTTDLVPGATMRKLVVRSEHIQSVASTIAALHHLQSERFGPVFGEDWWPGSAAEQLLRRCRWAVRQSQANSAVKEKIEAWLASGVSELSERRHWVLTHGDIKSTNLIWHETEEKAYLIDYEHMCYSWPELELAAMLNGKFGMRKNRAIFLEAYLAKAPSDVADTWHKYHDTFETLHLLLKAYRRWVQWRFPWFRREGSLTGERRMEDLNKLVALAHERIVGH
jgi:aminoglycoside phosphotransferase (APT) family kinase protein